MNQYDRRRALDSKLGRKLRDFLNDAVTDSRALPGKAALRARIEDEFGDVAGIDQDRLFNLFSEMARRAQEPGTRWDLRQTVTDVTARVVTKLDEADRLVEPDEEESIDVGAIADDIDYSDRIGGDLDRQADRERAEARELLRRAGYVHE